ncbi:MAG TPA: ribonuclease P protein component [Candidatus Saccharimonadaceae bacterium]|nr:ribonuclease P protein component [Candidatus Saccharimonadaceae bacterium]
MLSALHRFHGHGSLRFVYKNGQAVRSRLITIKHTTNPRRKHSRFAVVVSKKVLKSAVGRNRIRRRIYEIVRAELPHLSPGRAHDIVLLVFSSEVLTLSSDELVAVVRDLFTQADLYKK